MASLQSLKHLASKQRDRVERISGRATALDARGDAAEAKATVHFDRHEAFLDGLEAQIGEIETFNREMERDLGNGPERLDNGAKPLPGRDDPNALPGQKQEASRGTDEQRKSA